MDHLRFKTQQTAAIYVADGLDEPTQEAFELHMMGCAECVDDVEMWRALKNNVGAGNAAPAGVAPVAKVVQQAGSWRAAAAMAAVAIIGVAGGWYLRYLQASSPDLTDGSVAFLNLGPTLRGPADCSVVTLEAATTSIAVRVPGAQPDLTLAATRLDGKELSAGSFQLRTQNDGSWLAQISASEARQHGIRFTAQRADGLNEPLGCVSAR